MNSIYYSSFYLCVVALVSIVMGGNYKTLKQLIRKQRFEGFFALALMLFMVFFIGFRPPHAVVFADTVAYTHGYESSYGEPFVWDWKESDALFNNLLRFFAHMRIEIGIFYSFVALVYFGLAYVACRKWFPNNTLAAFLTFLAAFSTFSYATNGIRAGMAASVFLLGLAYRESLPLLILCFAASWSIHHSMHVVIVAYICVMLIKNRKIFFYIWLLSVLLSALHVTYFQTLFAGYSDEVGAGYLLSEKNEGFHTGFRLDFIIYSAMPVLVGYFMTFRYKVQNKIYQQLLNLYLLTNSVWMLAMYASFNNRIAYLSWFLYPVVLIYPFLNFRLPPQTHLRWFRYTFFGHLAFTLFMHFIYYA